MSRRPSLYSRIRVILESARAGISRTVNTTQVIANWLVGREIVEEEQQGKRRAAYGKKEIEALSEKLQAKFGKGYSVQNLSYMRQFYLTYPDLLEISPILHAARGKSMVTAARFQDEKTVAALGRQLGWTHMEGTQLTRGQAKAYIAQLIEEAVRS